MCLLDLAETALLSSALCLGSLSGEGGLLGQRAADRKFMVDSRASVCSNRSRDENATYTEMEGGGNEGEHDVGDGERDKRVRKREREI